MKIQLVSDLHLDISKHLELPGGDVLIIAGDACEAKELQHEYHSTKLRTYSGGRYPCYDFFRFECAKYKKVFYVMGNHEHYHGKLWKTADMLRNMLPSNVTLLENQSEEYEGVLFVGATLWTDMNRYDPVTMHAMNSHMNDYRLITTHHPIHNSYGKLKARDTANIHADSKKYIKETVEIYADMPVVVITHMAPTFESVHEMYRGDIANSAYCSDLSNIILDSPNIKFWVHGHMHTTSDYMVGDTRVLCNPRGYLPYEGDNGFDPTLTFEI